MNQLVNTEKQLLKGHWVWEEIELDYYPISGKKIHWESS